MQKVQGYNWRAWHDEETGIFTAEIIVSGAYYLYQIDEEIFGKICSEELTPDEQDRLIHTGRCLFRSVDDKCGPPYDIVYDEDYARICPWAKVVHCGETVPTELTDAVVELFASEKKNREYRRKKRQETEENI